VQAVVPSAILVAVRLGSRGAGLSNRPAQRSL